MLGIILATSLVLTSPDGRVNCRIETDGGVPSVFVRYADVDVGQMTVSLRSGPFELAGTSSVRSVSTSVTPVWGTASRYPESYNELELALKDKGDGRVRDWVSVRAYDEGVAVRSSCQTDLYGQPYFAQEASSFVFPEGTAAWAIPGTESTFGRLPTRLKDLPGDRQWRLPLTMKLPGGAYASLIEANVRDYPRANLKAEGGVLRPVFALGGKEGRGRIETPWRALILAPTAGGLIERSYLSELLNDPCAIGDASWIRPGLCVSDHGNCELTHGELLATARKAKEIGARYLQIDWGWYGTEVAWSEEDRTTYRDGTFKEIAAAHPGWEENTKADPHTVAKGHVPYHPTWPYVGRLNVDFDVPTLVKELRAMDMGLCLYVHGHVLCNSDLDELFALYESWGVAGLKPGFVPFGSQRSTEWIRHLAEVSARRHLWLDIHDEHIPDGFERTWPHVMITEGGGGAEGNHPVRQDVALPFTRCLIGPFDYTPVFFDKNRTHAHAAAMLLAYPGPTAIIRGKVADVADDPVASFVRELPWNYDESRVLAGEVADHLVVARRQGTTWHLAGLCGEEPRTVSVGLGFLGEGRYTATVTDDEGSRPSVPVGASDTLTLQMKVGGGAYAILTPAN